MFKDGKLWIAALGEKYAQPRIEALKEILSGSANYNADAQYAHILYLKELIADDYRITLANVQGPALVIMKK